MEDQTRQAGLRNPADNRSVANLYSDQPVYTNTRNLMNNSSTYASPHNQLVVNPGQLVQHNEDDYPPGFRFRPSDYELVMHYLRKKIRRESLPPNFIHEVELYRYSPEILAETHKPYRGEKEWYFLTPRYRKYKNGHRPNRAAGDGYWKATGADKPVEYRKRTYGSKKTLVFYRGKAPGGVKTNWIMHEFKFGNSPKVPRPINNGMRLDDWVLCRIHNKTDRPTRARSNEVQQDDEIEDQPLDQYNGSLVPRDNDGVDQVVDNIHAAVAENYNPGSDQLRCIDISKYDHNSDQYQQNFQNGQESGFYQDQALPSIPQSLDLPLEHTSSYVQQTISDYEISSFQLDNDLRLDFSLPTNQNIDELFRIGNNNPPPGPHDDDDDGN